MGDGADAVLFDAGLFIAALLSGHPKHGEARPLVEAARRGTLETCTTAAILSEVYGALTWIGAQPRHEPKEAALVTRLLIQAPSAISVLPDGQEAALVALDLAGRHGLTARRVHDARHAAVALQWGIGAVYTYDPSDWLAFESDGLRIAGPASTLAQLGPNAA